MSEQQDALLLANRLERESAMVARKDAEQAAAELRRLHAVNAELLDSLIDLCNRIYEEGATPLDWGEYEAARAAIAKAGG